VLLDIILRLEPFEFQIGFEFKYVYNLQKELEKGLSYFLVWLGLKPSSLWSQPGPASLYLFLHVAQLRASSPSPGSIL
jgi:hypothetical protein